MDLDFCDFCDFLDSVFCPFSISFSVAYSIEWKHWIFY